MNILETFPFGVVRRNHGIEHATVHVLTERDPQLSLVGRADTTGFNIYGEVDQAVLESATREAIARLQAGQGHLAVHPRCGTQIVVGGLLTGLAAAAAIGRRARLDKLPNIILATTMAAFVSPRVGLKVQEKITTSPDADGARFGAIRDQKLGSLKFRHVDIEWQK